MQIYDNKLWKNGKSKVDNALLATLYDSINDSLSPPKGVAFKPYYSDVHRWYFLLDNA